MNSLRKKEERKKEIQPTTMEQSDRVANAVVQQLTAKKNGGMSGMSGGSPPSGPVIPSNVLVMSRFGGVGTFVKNNWAGIVSGFALAVVSGIVAGIIVKKVYQDERKELDLIYNYTLKKMTDENRHRQNQTDDSPIDFQLPRREVMMASPPPYPNFH